MSWSTLLERFSASLPRAMLRARLPASDQPVPLGDASYRGRPDNVRAMTSDLANPSDAPTAAGHGGAKHRGVFAAGDQVQITDPKGRRHTVSLVAGKQFHTHQGAVEHDDLIGHAEGIVVTSTGGTAYLAFRPLLSDFVLSMPRGAAVVYPKDAAMIVGYADLFPGARVIEAGAGSGALSCSLLRAVGDAGAVYSFERRADFAAIATTNVTRFFGFLPPPVE